MSETQRVPQEWLGLDATPEQFAAAMMLCQDHSDSCIRTGICTFGDCFTSWRDIVLETRERITHAKNGAPFMTPDLQRIVEALKACRERYTSLTGMAGISGVWDETTPEEMIFSGTRDECLAYIDARFAEAMVRAIREPSTEMEVAGTEQWLCEAAMEDRSATNWRAMCDAILGETQP